MSFLSNTYGWTIFLILFVASSQAFMLLTPECYPHNLQGTYGWVNPCYERGCGILRLKSDEDDDDDDEEEEMEISGDWRAFRAKMVMSEKSQEKEEEPSVTTSETEEEEEDLDGIGALFSSSESTTTTTASTSTSKSTTSAENWNLDGEQWAYDSGKVIEQGAVILGGVEQAFGFGLRQQYFHKVVILVLSHEPMFTRGIILNRPSESLLNDKENDIRWRVWFGGDVQGLNSLNPEIVCLHSLTNEKVAELSTPVMKDIQWTTFENAKLLVKMGEAKHTDFWVFAGYAGWGPGQLAGELDRKSWYMCATDSQTLLKGLAKQSAFADARDAGLETWELLMGMIGHGDVVEECRGDFDDLMLKEWAREHLIASITKSQKKSTNTITSSAKAFTQTFQQVFNIDTTEKGKKKTTPKKDTTNSNNERPQVGSLVRASSAERSPFLLQNQEFHKSIVLVLNDEKDLAAGVILNLSASKGMDISITDNDTKKKRTITIPLRYGGAYAIKGQTNIMWLHSKSNLRNANVGSPITNDDEDEDEEGVIFRCSQEQAIKAIELGVASPQDFLVVTGLSIWTSGGMQKEVDNGNFEVVPRKRVDNVWKALQSQEVLSNLNIMKNLDIIHEAWSAGGSTAAPAPVDDVPTDGIGEGFDEEDDSLVYKSNVKVAKLSDDALRSWVATFLLGAPTLGA